MEEADDFTGDNQGPYLSRLLETIQWRLLATSSPVISLLNLLVLQMGGGKGVGATSPWRRSMSACRPSTLMSQKLSDVGFERGGIIRMLGRTRMTQIPGGARRSGRRAKGHRFNFRPLRSGILQQLEDAQFAGRGDASQKHTHPNFVSVQNRRRFASRGSLYDLVAALAQIRCQGHSD